MPRHSAAVYRRRRLAVLLLLVLLVALSSAGVWLAVAQPWTASAGPTPSAAAEPSPKEKTPLPAAPDSPPVTPSDSPSPDPTEAPGIVACEAEDVEVTAVTDAETYAAGVLPKLSITLTSKSDHDCTLNVGSSTQKFTVTSGKDVWWRSTDCQTEPSDQIATLTAGSTVSTHTPVVWDRTRSAADTCDQKNRARAPGHGASYHVTASIGGFDSVASRQIILR